MASFALVALALVLVPASAGPAGWNVPSSWRRGSEYVVVMSGNDPSNYGGYIFPGPNPASSSKSVAYASPDGFYCEAKHYDMNYGVFATQECANAWTKLITDGDNAQATVEGCTTIPTAPCGCQSLCRPVDCT